MKKKICFLTVVCIIISIFSGCNRGNGSEQIIVGEWYYYSGFDSIQWEFFEDKDMVDKTSDKSYTWSITEDKKTLKLTDQLHNIELHEIVSLDKDTLILDIGTFKRTADNAAEYMKENFTKRLKTDHAFLASELDRACKKLYAGSIAGSIDSSSPADELGNLDPSKLPMSFDKTYQKFQKAKNLTIQDAIDYEQLGEITTSDISDLYYNKKNLGTIEYQRDVDFMEYGILRLDTTLGELYSM